MALNWKGNPIGDKMAFNVRKEFPFKHFIFTNDYKFNILGVMGVKKFNYIPVFSSPF